MIAGNWWYNNAPHTFPTGEVTFWWGMWHGFTFAPNFVYALFNSRVEIYQSPNHHVYYMGGWIIGMLVFLFLVDRLFEYARSRR